MHTTTLLTASRVAGGLGLGALLLYGGAAMGASPDLGAAEAGWLTVLGLLLAVAAAWSLSRLEGSTIARVVALVTTGVVPIVTFLGWIVTRGVETTLVSGLLWLNLVAGLLALAALGWLMMAGASSASGRSRTTRV